MRFQTLAAILCLSTLCTVAHAQAIQEVVTVSKPADPDVVAVDEFVREIREPVIAARIEREAAIESAIAEGSGSWLEWYIATQTGGGRLSDSDLALYVDELAVDSLEDLYTLGDETETVSFNIVGLKGGDQKWILYLSPGALATVSNH